MRQRAGPAPDLVLGADADGLVLANLRPEALGRAMEEAHEGILERMTALPESDRNVVHTHVLMHLDGTTVRPWCVPGRVCVFGTVPRGRGSPRVFVVLEDTAPEPRPETANQLLQMMVASGTDD